MKKIVLAAVMLLSSVSMFAQQDVGSLTIQPKVGLNVSNVTKTNGDTRIGVAAGAEAEYQLGDIYSIAVGLLYSSQGNKQTVDLPVLGKASVTWAPSYLNIPVVANVYVVKNLAVKLGVQPGFCVAKDKLKANTFDLSIPVGLSYEYKDFVLDGRYNFGVTNIAKGVNTKNSVFQFTLGYKLPLSR